MERAGSAGGHTGRLLIRNATIIDGTGAPPVQGDLLIRDGRIEDIGQLPGAQADRVIDAAGLTATPGFIDTHVHTDMTLLDEPVHECLLRQGVTTVVMGQDGLSYAPLSRENQALFRRYLSGLNGDARTPLSWESVSEYRQLFDRTVSLNTAYCFPHAALRLETAGFRDVPLTTAELRRARTLLERGFEEGAAGFSTGLSYFPGTYAGTDELVHFSEVAAAAGRPYVTHVRSVFAAPQADWLRCGLEEALSIGELSGAHVHVSHFGPKPWRYASVPEMLEPVATARQRGVNVTLEVYPYPAGNTFFLIHLPPWAHEGGPGALLELIRSGCQREQLVRSIEENTISPFGTVVSHVPDPASGVLGRRIDDIARERGVSVGEAVLQLLDEHDLTVGALEGLPDIPDLWPRYEAALVELLQRGDYMIGSDAIPAARIPHPRTYGTFPRVLGLLREQEALPAEQAVHLLTGLPARTFGLADRGELRKGAWADVALFRPGDFLDHATYASPDRPATGLDWLFVNGEAVISSGTVTGLLPGRAVS